MNAFLIAATALMSATGPSSPQPREVRIPFVGFNSIRNFQPVGNHVVYFQDARRNWYRATLNGPCFNLEAAIRIGVDTRFSGDTLDNTSSLLVDGQRCRIDSLVRSEPPPRRQHRR